MTCRTGIQREGRWCASTRYDRAPIVPILTCLVRTSMLLDLPQRAGDWTAEPLVLNACVWHGSPGETSVLAPDIVRLAPPGRRCRKSPSAGSRAPGDRCICLPLEPAQRASPLRAADSEQCPGPTVPSLYCARSDAHACALLRSAAESLAAGVRAAKSAADPRRAASGAGEGVRAHRQRATLRLRWFVAEAENADAKSPGAGSRGGLGIF
jgi:hypothetical protein